MKQRLNEPTINKIQILQWINSTLNCNQSKIQSLGNGIIYCMLMNHYYPNSVPKNKIIMVPRNNMDNKANLKKVQEALLHQNIRSITFDIFRVSEMSYLDNWQLVCKFYRHFDELTKNSQKNSQKQPEISNIISENAQLMNQNVQQIIPQPQNPYILPKQITKTPDFGAGLLTPMKGLKFFEQNTKMRYQALRLMQEIKAIVKSETQTDKIKVKNLKKMLGLIEEEREEEELEMKELFSDCTRKQEVITID